MTVSSEADGTNSVLSSPTSSSVTQLGGDLKPSLPICPFIDEEHIGKEIINCLVDCCPSKIYRLLFTDPEFMIRIFEEHNYYDVNTSKWETDTAGNLKRIVTFTATLPSSTLGPSTCSVTENQTASTVNKDNALYVVNKETSNAGIPYADNFKIHTHYCITKVMPDTSGSNVSSRFSYFCNITFKKGTLFFIKNLIEKNAIQGCEAMGNSILSALMREVKGESVPLIKRRKAARRKPKSSKNSRASRKCRISFMGWLLFTLLVAAGIANIFLFLHVKRMEATKYRNWICKIQMTLPSSDAVVEEIGKMAAKEGQIYTVQMQLWKDHLLPSIDALDKIEHSLRQALNMIYDMKNDWKDSSLGNSSLTESLLTQDQEKREI